MLIYLSTKSKKTKKQKEKDREKYLTWCKTHKVALGKKSVLSGKDKSPVVVTKKFIRETEFIPSKDSGVTGAVICNVKKEFYTGNNMLGIASMHKSNFVPVFKEDDAVDLAHMRR